MIEFALSKLNLLIFVTAVAAIVVFFMGAVNSNMKIRQSYELVYKVGKELSAGIESNSYCTVKFITLPQKIYTNSGNSDAFTIKYKLNISSNVSPTQDPDSLEKKLVLAIIDRKTNNPKIYAAYDIDYEGEVRFYDANYDGDTGNYDFSEPQEIVNYDPLKTKSIDTTLLFIKEIKNGKSIIYLIPCVRRNDLYQCKGFLETSGLKESVMCLDAIPDLFREPTTITTN